MKKFVLLVALAALALPGVAAAGKGRGVVVKVNPRNGVVAVAQGRGAVALVHVRGVKLRPGQTIAFQSRKLRNGTFAGTAVRVVGKARRIHVRGLVLQRKRGVLVLSARGAILKVGTVKRGRAPASRQAESPAGSIADVTVEFGQNGSLGKVDETVVDGSAATGAIEGHLTAIDAGVITVTDGGVSLKIAVPSSLDISNLKLDQDVIAYFERAADGTLTLTAIGGDETETEADDPDEIDGDVDAAEQDLETEDGAGAGPAEDADASVAEGVGNNH